ncbi:MAG TPA: DUF2334 domain-containing protein [Gammaproteobacteria bacterium]|nr:DUF2334 domain-containing protein [Gammaproteobacteria bacterium]
MIYLFLVSTSYATETKIPAIKCVQIYYDKPTNDPSYLEGRIDVVFLQNLLGHFSNIQQYIIPISKYQSGDFNKCIANIYIGSNYKNSEQIPAAFLADFVTTQRNVAWFKYGIWRLTAADLKKLWGVNFDKVEDIDTQHKDPSGKPGFYNAFSYRNASFSAYGEFEKSGKNFLHSSDTVVLKPVSQNMQAYTLSWATHSSRGDKIPYILRNNNHWYIADTPFSYVDYGDRYFILSDILFDIIEEKPVNNGKKYALVRFEDVSPFLTSSIKPMVDVFIKEKIPFAVSLIPIYNDPLKVYNFTHYEEMTADKNFLQGLKYAQDHGGSFLLHGVTHQYNNVRNPVSGVSGEDFEFWDKIHEQPIKEDSVSYVLNRLNKGISLLQSAGISFQGWLTPHYLASSLDNTIFGQVFIWNVGQVSYVLNKTCNLTPIPDALTYNIAGVNKVANEERLRALQKLQVINIPGAARNDEYHPYEVYGDYYGQRVIPEDLGDIQPYLNNQVTNLRGVDDLLKDAKRLSVLRDVWASFFIHAQLLNTRDQNGLAKFPGDTSEIERLISGIQSLGYEFVDLRSWTKTHTKPKPPAPIEIDPIVIKCPI